MITYIWKYIRDIAQNTHQRYSSQRLVTDGSDDEDGGEDGLNGHPGGVDDGHEKRSMSYAERVVASKPSWPYWLFLTVLAVIAIFSSIQAIKYSPTTHLVADVLTTDGKPFPHGHLSYSADFSPLPCGNTIRGHLPRLPLRHGCHRVVAPAMH